MCMFNRSHKGGFKESYYAHEVPCQDLQVGCRVMPRHAVGEAVSDRVVLSFYYWKYLC
jgi:hypothetical protein